MKRLSGCLLMAALMVSCADLDLLRSEIDALSEKLQKIEQNCDRLNTDLVALSKTVSALQMGDMVTSVSPVTAADGTVEGYIINFLNSGLVTIYHGRPGDAGLPGEPGKDGVDGNDGQDGQDGAPGKDGADASAPVISVRQDSDGKYYWTADGEWITDAEGNRVEVDKGGKAPQMKVEENKWYVSYDGGASWIYLADFVLSADGYVFQEVDTSDPDCVRITLSDGTVMELPKYKEKSVSLKCETTVAPGGSFELFYTVNNATSVSVSVDDSDVASAVVSASDGVSGTVSVALRPNVALVKQRLFLIFAIDGAADDWWIVSFDNSGNVAITDIR